MKRIPAQAAHTESSVEAETVSRAAGGAKSHRLTSKDDGVVVVRSRDLKVEIPCFWSKLGSTSIGSGSLSQPALMPWQQLGELLLGKADRNQGSAKAEKRSHPHDVVEDLRSQQSSLQAADFPTSQAQSVWDCLGRESADAQAQIFLKAELTCANSAHSAKECRL